MAWSAGAINGIFSGMLTERMSRALNEQLNAEFASSYAYLSLAAHFGAQSLPGLSHWFRTHAEEEQAHAMKIFDYILTRGGTITLASVPAPPAPAASPREAFADAFRAESEVSAAIDALVEIAVQEKDRATQVFLDWFVAEQVEEEALFSELHTQIDRIGDSEVGLFVFDQKLGERTPDTSGAGT